MSEGRRELALALAGLDLTDNYPLRTLHTLKEKVIALVGPQAVAEAERQALLEVLAEHEAGTS